MRGSSASLRERVLRHFGAEPFGVGKVRDRAWMPDGQITDQLGQSAKLLQLGLSLFRNPIRCSAMFVGIVQPVSQYMSIPVLSKCTNFLSINYI